MRVPCLIQWPGHILAGRVSNGIQSHEDLYVTLASAASMPDLKDELLKGKKMGSMTYKVHLDGYNNLDLWTGKADKFARLASPLHNSTSQASIPHDHRRQPAPPACFLTSSRQCAPLCPTASSPRSTVFPNRSITDRAAI